MDKLTVAITSMTQHMTDDEFMRDVLQRIATGPTLSKDLPRNDARRAMRIVLEQRADEVQAGLFLIALRMKRETDEELAGILEAIHAGITPHPVKVDDLVVLVDPYDGYLRSTPVAPFLPAVLAACGLKVLTHGVHSMGPKFGATHEQVLTAAAMTLPTERAQASALLEHDNCGWACLSQTQLAPELAGLTTLRTRIVKRPCLTTIEVAVNSLKPHKAVHLVTGFVHKPYPPVYARLASTGGFASSIVIRGIEGGVVPSLTQASRYFTSTDGHTLTQADLAPSQVGIQRQERAVPLPASLSSDSVRSVKSPENPFAQQLAEHAAEVGLAALAGEPGYARDSLVYAGAVILVARGAAANLSHGADQVRTVLDNAQANAHFRQAGAMASAAIDSAY